MLTFNTAPLIKVLDDSDTEPLCTVTITLQFVLFTPTSIATEPVFEPLVIVTSLDAKDIFAPLSLLDA